eukprot:EG_transcript_768
MRLSTTFLLVLAVSAILTSMAAWGITFGTSYDKVSSMALEFTTLAKVYLGEFGTFVSDVLGSNAQLVESILALQRLSGFNRTEETKAEMTRTIGVLVNYTTDATDQTQVQMMAVVNTFASLVSSVVADFKGVASAYASQVRTGLVTMASDTIVSNTNRVVSLLKRMQRLVDLRLLNISRAPTDPVQEQDCALLSLLCDGTQEYGPEYGAGFSLATATGRIYRCGSYEGATLSVISTNGIQYNEYYWTWLPSAATDPAAALPSILQRCLNETPTVRLVGQNCPQPQGCNCGSDPRCAPWYQPHRNSSAYHFSTDVLYDQYGTAGLHMSMSMVDSSTKPSPLLGVVDLVSPLAVIDLYLGMLSGFSPDLYLAALLNDTALTMLGSTARPCGANETAPGDQSLPLRSSLRACDPSLRAVAQLLASNPSVTAAFSLEAHGRVLDVLPVYTPASWYFFVAGANKSVINQAVDASDARAAAQLAAVRQGLVEAVVASGAASRAYMTAVGAQNLRATQAMQDSFLTQIQALENSSRAALTLSQQQSSANVQRMTHAQASAVEAQRTYYLDSMATTSGWTIAVVFAMLIVVLLASAWGTFRVTQDLTHIIGQMEDVAEMKVENLVVPQNSRVAEVARIQAAFQVLVNRLVEYKSYIPAGVFEKAGTDPQPEASYEGGPIAESASEYDLSSTSSPRREVSQTSFEDSKVAYCRRTMRKSVHVGGSSMQRSASIASVGVSPGRRALQRNVAVLSVNVAGFLDVLRSASDGLSKGIISEYITYIHATVSQHRGNVDCILGDQAFVTFNAHLPCSDPAGAAAAAALELQKQVVSRMGDRLKFHMGASFGLVFASSAGYAKFKYMVTVGSPMKMAALLSRLPHLANGAILSDAALEERLKYSYSLRPVELAHLPNLATLAKCALNKSQRIFALLSSKQLREDEWIYQVGQAASSDWNQTFEQLVATLCPEERQSLLGTYLAGCPHDEIALRLRDRLPLWLPGLGIPL